MTKGISHVLAIALLLLIAGSVYSYDNEYVHQNINRNAAMQAVNFFNTMKNLGFEALTSEQLLEIYVGNRKIKTWFEVVNYMAFTSFDL